MMASTTVAASSEHPVCSKRGQLVVLSESCCSDLSTWAQQMVGIAEWYQLNSHLSEAQKLQQQKDPLSSVLPIAHPLAHPTWCDFIRLSYDEYVACDCHASPAMDFIGNNLTLQCPIQSSFPSELVQLPSDYQCLPRSCSRQEAHTLLVNNATLYHPCQIVQVSSGVTPSWNQPPQSPLSSSTVMVLGILMALALLGAALGQYQRMRWNQKNLLDYHECNEEYDSNDYHNDNYSMATTKKAGFNPYHYGDDDDDRTWSEVSIQIDEYSQWHVLEETMDRPNSKNHNRY